MLLISPSVTGQITQDSRCAYPQECCGLLLGQEVAGARIVQTVVCCKNTALQKRVAYRIAAEAYMQTEQYASAHNLQVLGVFHSHPNCVAVPSLTDTIGALPNFSYLIVSVNNNSISEIRSWRLCDERLFWKEEHLHIIVKQ